MLEVYSPEEITVKKTIALVDGARNEPRDLYDLWHLTSNEGIELSPLVDAMRHELAFRGKPREAIANVIQKKETRLKALWSSRLAYQMNVLPKFDEICRDGKRLSRTRLLACLKTCAHSVGISKSVHPSSVASLLLFAPVPPRRRLKIPSVLVG